MILCQNPRRGCSRTSQYAPPPDGGFSLSDAKISPSDIPKPFCVIPGWHTVSEPCPRPLTYGKYVTEIRDTQKGRKVRPSLRLVVGLNRAADCVTARASNECVGGASACGFCRFRKRRHSRRRTRGHLVRWKEKDICPQVFAIFPTITKRRRASRLLFVMVGLNRLELSTSRLSGVCSNQLSYNPLVPLSGGLWWRCTDSNRGPLECKSSALPTELHPRGECLKMIAPA